MLIDSNENTFSVISFADTICGGTIGIEFACQGKPVILAASPSYSNLGFTKDCKSVKKYERTLLNSHNLKKLNHDQRQKALLTAYLMFCRLEKNVDDLEIGPERIYLGKNYNEKQLLQKIQEYQKISIQDQKVYSVINNFLKTTNRLGLY